MSFTIAVAGKGGVGKTTVASLIIRHLVKAGNIPLLAVDADPNSSLHVNLGLKFDTTVSDIREDMDEKKIPSGMTRIQFMSYKLEQTLVESRDIDLLVMGRPEGQGCYCAVNNLLRQYLSKLSGRYKYVVMDNEAGMEHLSRRTTDDVDVLLIVTEPTLVSLHSAVRVRDTAKGMKLKIKNIYLVVNKSGGHKFTRLEQEIKKNNLTLLEKIPEDNALLEASEENRDLLSLPGDSPSVLAVGRIVEKIMG